MIAPRAAAFSALAVASLAGLAVALALEFAGLRLVRITSASMEPAVTTGGVVVVYERPLEIEELQRGTIALFRFPPGSGLSAIKRVVALPGDLVEVRDDAVIVNGSRIAAAFPLTQAQVFQPVPPSVIEPGRVFLLGDNAPASIDSRSFGTAPITDIQGTVLFVLPIGAW